MLEGSKTRFGLKIGTKSETNEKTSQDSKPL